MPRKRPKAAKARGANPSPSPGITRPPVPDAPLPSARAIRDLFREAFETLGGAHWLVEFAQESDANARVFVAAITRLLPLEVTGKDGAPLTILIQTADGQVAVDLDHPSTMDGDYHEVPGHA